MKAQGAQPAFRLVLGRVRERHRCTGKRDDQGGVLGEGDVLLLPHTSSIGRRATGRRPRTRKVDV
jgi:hypothetical protein